MSEHADIIKSSVDSGQTAPSKERSDLCLHCLHAMSNPIYGVRMVAFTNLSVLIKRFN